LNFNIQKYDKKNVSIQIRDGTILSGRLHLHYMNYPNRIILEVNDKYIEEFQVINIEERILKE
jgi:hypothetical protein